MVRSRSAEELHRAAVDLANRGLLDGATRRLDRAAAASDDTDLRARIDGTRAYVAARTGRFDEAEALLLAALATRGVSARTAAILSGQMGSLEDHRGRLAEAERWLTRAVAALDAQDDAESVANLLMNRSVLRMRRMRLDGAAADCRRAVELYAEAGEAVAEAQARHNLGYIALLEGDLVAALGSMSAARRALSGVSAVATATVDVDLAEVYRDAGLASQAESMLARAAAVFGGHGMPGARADAELQLARSLLAHDPARARRVAGAAERRFTRLGDPAGAARSGGIRVRAELRAGASADVAARDRTSRPDRSPEATAASLARHGFAGEAAGVRLAAALARARRGTPGERMPRVPAASPMEVRLLAAETRAARAAAGGRSAGARRHAAAGLDALAHWQDAFGSLDLQSSLGAHGRELLTVGMTSAVASGRPDVVFEWSERARHLHQRVLPLRPPPDAGLADDLAGLRMLRADDPAWLQQPRARELHDRVRERQWAATGSAAVQGAIALAELRETLDADTALLAYVWTGSHLACLAVASDRTTLVPLPEWSQARDRLAGLRSDLDMAASMREGALGAVIRQSLDRRLTEISRALLDDPLAVVGARRLVVTAPGVLAGLPWAMLPALAGRTFTLATSATRWAHARDATSAPVRAGFAVGPRVVRGAEEVAAAAAAWSMPAIRDGDDATVDALTALAAEVDVLHVAAHGRHTADNPLFSGLDLADGALFGYDIDLIPRVPAAVVLSSCEVGRSTVRGGEEAIGMTRVWLHAGARAVVATPVVVADDDACELLGALHAGLAAGLAPAEALAEASARTGVVSSFQVHGNGF